MRPIFVALLLTLALMSHAPVWASEELPPLKIQQLTDSVYLHISHKVVDGFGLVDSNGLVVLMGSEAYIVDTPWSTQDTETLLQWINAQGFTLKGVVSTHFHEDRTAGIEYLNANAIPTYASARTNKILQRQGRPLAANTFNKDKFSLVKAHIEVFYPGAGHAQDNVVVWLPEQKLLFGGCLIRANAATSLGNTSDAVLSAWSASVEELQSRYADVKLVVPGHGDVGDVSLLEHTRVLATVGRAVNK